LIVFVAFGAGSRRAVPENCRVALTHVVAVTAEADCASGDTVARPCALRKKLVWKHIATARR
jgi:hypothetical protein